MAREKCYRCQEQLNKELGVTCRLCKEQGDGVIVLYYAKNIGIKGEITPGELGLESPQTLEKWGEYLSRVSREMRVFVREVDPDSFPPEQLKSLRQTIKKTSSNPKVYWILQVSEHSLQKEELNWLRDAPDCGSYSSLPISAQPMISTGESPKEMPNPVVPQHQTTLPPGVPPGKAPGDLHPKEAPMPKAPTLDSIHILHLSDLHLSQQRKADQYYAQLAEDLRGGGLDLQQLDYLAVSGDVANLSTEAEYQAARNFFDRLTRDFNLRKDHIILVPGNHDLNWSLSRQAYSQFIDESELPTPLPDNHIREENGIRVRDRAKWLQRLKHFQDFYRSLCGQDYPLEHDQQGVVYNFAEDKLVFLGLNSAWDLGHSVKNAVLDKPSINPHALNGLLELMTGTYQDWLKIAVWHHPIRGKEAMDPYFIERLCKAGFQIYMSGHIHEAIAGFHHYDEVRKIIEIGAGTFGAIAHQTPGVPLQYNVLKLDRETCTLTVMTRKREHEDGAWEADARWVDRDKDPKWFYNRPVTWGRCKGASSHAGKNETQPEQVEASDDESVTAARQSALVPKPSKKITVLFMAANPKNTERLRLDKEIRAIDQGLRLSSQQDRFVLEKQFATRTGDIIDHILRYRPDIVHFSGHGSPNGDLIFEDESGQAKAVSAAALGQLFATSEHVRCVILNACWSDTHADSIVNTVDRVVDCVIGTMHSIDDAAAIGFASGFYRSLGEGLNIKKAFELGKVQIILDGMEDANKFHLKMRPMIDPAKISF
jgi:hypothetical protein